MTDLNELTTEQAYELLEQMIPGKSPEVRMSIVTLAGEMIASGAPSGNAYSLGPSPDGRYITIEVRYEDGRSVAQEAARLQAENETLRSQVSQAGDFIRELFAHFPESFPDGFDIQDVAEKHGILTHHKPVAPCGNGCWCDEYYSRDEWDNGEASCLRLSTWLTAVKEGE